MYAKDIRPPRRPSVTPPQNYSGTAFSEPRHTVTPKVPSPKPPPAVAEPPTLPPPLPAPPPENKTPEQSAPVSASECTEFTECTECTKCTEDKTPSPRGILSSLIPPGFSDSDADFGFEELLLVGLIFLLSRGESDSDILLMLALLLLYR